MTREEYAKRMKKHPDWAPGRDAIEAAFARRYPETEPVCFESELHDRAALGGEVPLSEPEVLAWARESVEEALSTVPAQEAAWMETP